MRKVVLACATVLLISASYAQNFVDVIQDQNGFVWTAFTSNAYGFVEGNQVVISRCNKTETGCSDIMYKVIFCNKTQDGIESPLSIGLNSNGFPMVAFSVGPYFPQVGIQERGVKLALCKDIDCSVVSIIPIAVEEYTYAPVVFLAGNTYPSVAYSKLQFLANTTFAGTSLELVYCLDSDCSQKSPANELLNADGNESYGYNFVGDIPWGIAVALDGNGIGYILTQRITSKSSAILLCKCKAVQCTVCNPTILTSASETPFTGLSAASCFGGNQTCFVWAGMTRWPNSTKTISGTVMTNCQSVNCTPAYLVSSLNNTWKSSIAASDIDTVVVAFSSDSTVKNSTEDWIVLAPCNQTFCSNSSFIYMERKDHYEINTGIGVSIDSSNGNLPTLAASLNISFVGLIECGDVNCSTLYSPVTLDATIAAKICATPSPTPTAAPSPNKSDKEYFIAGAVIVGTLILLLLGLTYLIAWLVRKFVSKKARPQISLNSDEVANINSMTKSLIYPIDDDASWDEGEA